MYFSRILILFILGTIIVSCTKQSPANIKNPSIPVKPIKPECNQITFENKVLAKKNILNLFECSGWRNKYPNLFKSLGKIDSVKFDNVLKVFNEGLFNSKEKRSQLFKLISQSEANGELNAVSQLLETALGEHKLLKQANRILKKEEVNSPKSHLLNLLSENNNTNLQMARLGKKSISSFEMKKNILGNMFDTQASVSLRKKFVKIIDEIAKKMSSEDWLLVSSLLYDGESTLLKWAQGGIHADLSILLRIIEKEKFISSISFLKNSIEKGISCKNSANIHNFHIDVAQELKHKIDSLKNDTKEDFEKNILHGLSKFIAFNDFCEEKQFKQGLEAFFDIVDYSSTLASSDHDYVLLKEVHLRLKENRYRFLDFLVSNSFQQFQRILTDLRKNNYDEDFVRTFYEIFIDIGENSFNDLSSLITKIGTRGGAQNWVNSFSQIWISMNEIQKKELLSLMLVFFENNINTSDAISMVVDMMEKFPNLSTSLAHELGNIKYQKNLKYIINHFDDPSIQEELVEFMSKDGIFELFKILSNDSRKSQKKISPIKQVALRKNYVEEITVKEISAARLSCLNHLSKSYKENVNYYYIVNNLSNDCLKVLGQVGFVGQIYIWMNESNKFFNSKYGVSDFHSEYGVWAPGMLHFIFSAAIKIDENLKNENGNKGILYNIDEIYNVLTSGTVLESVHKFSLAYQSFHNNSNIDSRLLKYITTKSDEEINNLLSLTFETFQNGKREIDFNSYKNDCKELNPNHGVNPCLGLDESKSIILDILRVIKRKNEEGESLLKVLVSWIHPAGGIVLPNTENKVYRTSLDEIIRFLLDLSSISTMKTINYVNDRVSREVEATTLDRLEIVIRDIGFLNNYYGAFFKNQVATSNNYRKEIVASEKLITFLQAAGGPFRGLNKLPRDSRWRLKNVKSSYSSLVELSDNFTQPDGSVRSYDLFIQSLLAGIMYSSKLRTQTFNAYRIPNERIVEGHNGVFLTKMVQASSLRKLSVFLKSRFNGTKDPLNSKIFKLINQNLIARFELNQLKASLQETLDKYLDNDKNQLNLMLDDLFNFLEDLSLEDQEKVEEILVKLLYVISSEEMNVESVKKLLSLGDILIKNWPIIREPLLKLDSPTQLFIFTNQFLDNVLTNLNNSNLLLKELLDSQLLNSEDFDSLFSDNEFLQKAIEFINNLAVTPHVDSKLNWEDVLTSTFASPDLKWGALKAWLQQALGGDPEKLSVSLLISVIGQKNSDGYKLKFILDELLIKQREQLKQFLINTFPSMKLSH